MALDDYMTPTTVLQAVNVIMEAAGQTPIASLASVDTNVEAEAALNRLGEVSREVQQEGWDFNTEIDFEIPKNVDGTITLPANTLKVVQKYFSGGYNKDLVRRGDKLYDRRGHTYNIGMAVKVDLVLNLDFTELPEAARDYITKRAARRHTSGKLVSSTAYQFTKADEDSARLRFEQAHDETSSPNLMNNPHVRRTRRR